MWSEDFDAGIQEISSEAQQGSDSAEPGDGVIGDFYLLFFALTVAQANCWNL